MTAKPNAPTNIKTAIHNASSNFQSTVSKTETAAVSMVDKVEDAMSSVKASAKQNFESVKSVSSDIIEVVDNAGRTVVGGVVTLQSSIVNYGKDVVNDTIETGRKTLEVKSLSDAVQLQAEFAERRINALFQTVTAVNTINHNNVIAMWAPLASMIGDLTGKTAEMAKASQSAFKSAA
jgi:hypothetical protein